MATQPLSTQDAFRALNSLKDRIPDLSDAQSRLEKLEASMGLVYPKVQALTEQRNLAAVGGLGGDPANTATFAAYLRNPRGGEAQLGMMELSESVKVQNNLSGTTDPAGGFLIPSEIVGPLQKRVGILNPWRDLVRVIQVGTRYISLPLSNANMASGWIGETVARTGTTAPSLHSAKPTFGTIYSLVSVAEELMNDSAFPIQDWLLMESADKFAADEAAAIVSGNGTDKPTGFLNTAPEAAADGSRTSANALRYIPSGAAATLGSDIPGLLAKTIYDLKAGYRQNAVWAMNSATAGALMSLKDTTGRPLWSDGLAIGQPASLYGYRVVISEAMPDIGTNAHPIAFGDFSRAYVLAEINDLRIGIDDNITAPGFVKFYMRRRLGGCVYDNNAVRVIKCATT